MGVAEVVAQRRARHSRTAWRIAAGVAVLAVVAGVVIAAVMLTGSQRSPFGEVTARLAAQRFVTAVNAGNKDGAAGEACANFADEARSVAESGRDPDIDFVLGAVQVSGPAAATAIITQELHFTGSVQRVQHTVDLERTAGRWVVCGQS